MPDAGKDAEEKWRVAEATSPDGFYAERNVLHKYWLQYESDAQDLCDYLNALQQQLADVTRERDEARAKTTLAIELGEKELYAIWHAAASDTFESFRD